MREIERYPRLKPKPHLRARGCGAVRRFRVGQRDNGDRGETGSLEIAEKVLMSDAQSAAVAKHRELRRLGVRPVVEDFGTVYSSLSHLGRLPMDLRHHYPRALPLAATEKRGTVGVSKRTCPARRR